MGSLRVACVSLKVVGNSSLSAEENAKSGREQIYLQRIMNSDIEAYFFPTKESSNKSKEYVEKTSVVTQ